ncbi:helix-turn-helix transcriptional regulator [Martelella alba]|uniref:Helix-turn-helix transcriptional regulator n=1 Tax=Martelella alba TaxID=2590451 RepID=A0ABY2SLH1_9HYPH|nr:helix-turn-helix transcriptional regulator [Martelella alba]TKI06558.1 helix-turn-helix transcriptional regulator [Martelella alba]
MNHDLSEAFAAFEAYSINISKQLLILWESSSEPWGVKNTDSRYVYANKAYYELLNLDPSSVRIEGHYDDELPCSIAKFAWFFKEHDRHTLALKDRLCSLEIHCYGPEQILKPYYFDKFPLFDNTTAKCVGIIFHARKLENYSLLEHINGEEPGTFCFFPPEDLFSEGELDVIFFVLQSLSSKHIAKKLNRSHRTIENRLQQIYQKAGVHSLGQFQEFCKAKGYDRYIPQKFFQPGSRMLTASHN